VQQNGAFTAAAWLVTHSPCDTKIQRSTGRLISANHSFNADIISKYQPTAMYSELLRYSEYSGTQQLEYSEYSHVHGVPESEYGLLGVSTHAAEMNWKQTTYGMIVTSCSSTTHRNILPLASRHLPHKSHCTHACLLRFVPEVVIQR
jgi:hypothetical protein